MSPSQNAVRSGPGVIYKWFVRAKNGQELPKLTRSLVGFCVVVISRFTNVAVPIDSSTMGPDAESLVQSLLGARVE